MMKSIALSIGLAVSVIFCSQRVFAQPSYFTTSPVPQPANEFYVPARVNSFGLTAGSASQLPTAQYLSYGRFTATFGSQVFPFPPPINGTIHRVAAVNDNFEVIGVDHLITVGTQSSFYVHPQYGFYNIPNPLGRNFVAASINSSGVAVGHSFSVGLPLPHMGTIWAPWLANGVPADINQFLPAQPSPITEVFSLADNFDFIGRRGIVSPYLYYRFSTGGFTALEQPVVPGSVQFSGVPKMSAGSRYAVATRYVCSVGYVSCIGDIVYWDLTLALSGQVLMGNVLPTPLVATDFDVVDVTDSGIVVGNSMNSNGYPTAGYVWYIGAGSSAVFKLNDPGVTGGVPATSELIALAISRDSNNILAAEYDPALSFWNRTYLLLSH